MSRRNIISIEWNSAFAYAIGLLATDGNLSSDGRHIHFTSKDLQLVLFVKEAFHLLNSIGRKGRGGNPLEKKYYVIQFGSVQFYKFLLEFGLKPNKSKTLGVLRIPDIYFFDFLRGCLDGDGSIGAFKHPDSKNLQLRIRFYSASLKFLRWLHRIILKKRISGYLNVGKGVYLLAYSMQSSIQLLQLLYPSEISFCLGRKYNIAKSYLRA